MPSLNSVLRRPFDGAGDDVPLTALQRAVLSREGGRRSGKDGGASSAPRQRRRWRLEPVEIASAGRVSYPPGDARRSASAKARPSRRAPERAPEASYAAATGGERRRRRASSAAPYTLETLRSARRGSKVALDEAPPGSPAAAQSPPRAERDVAERPPATPAGDERPLKPAADAGAASAWEAVVTPEGDTYYYHTASGLSQWRRPACLKRDFRECCYDAETNELAWEPPPGAEVVAYADTQQPGAARPRYVRCYYDAVSGETCWAPPDDDGGGDGDAAPEAAPVVDEAPDLLGESLEAPVVEDEEERTRDCWYDPATERMFWDQRECSDPESALPCVYDERRQRIAWATELPPPAPVPEEAAPDADGGRGVAAPPPPADDRGNDAGRHAALNEKMEEMQAQLRIMEAQLRARGIVPGAPDAGGADL